jgi:cell division protein YceG involved in septum cleavage
VPPSPEASEEHPLVTEPPAEEMSSSAHIEPPADEIPPPADVMLPEEYPEAVPGEHPEPDPEHTEHHPEPVDPVEPVDLPALADPQTDESPAPEFAESPHAPEGPGEGFEEPPQAEAEPSPAAAAAEEHDTRGFPIPGIEPPAPSPAREGLPPAPPPLRRPGRDPMRRAFRREAPVTAAAGSRHRGGIASRIAALIALLAVVAAIVLLIHSLTRSSHSVKPVTGPVVVKVLIPEGKTRVQIAEIAKGAGLKGSYRGAARRSDLLNPVHYGAPHGTPDLEGFLFPATYELDKGAPAKRLLEEQLAAFQENFSSEDAKRAHELGVTPYQLLTVASMVEREAEVPGDRAKIAAVIYNRLKAGMPLGIDASIYYAVEQEKGIATYTHELTESQLKIDSPYNTRTHTGLPPTPISNPGTASIQAAAHPAHVAYLYYVAGADGCGEQVFSDSQADFETNVAAYEAAKSKNGGHPPACKHH